MEWYYKLYLLLSKFLSFIKINGDLTSYKDVNIYLGAKSVLGVFLPLAVIIYTVVMIWVTSSDYYTQINSHKKLKLLTYLKITIPLFIVSLIINIFSMIVFFWLIFLFNQIGWTILFFVTLIVVQLIVRFNDDYNNESVFNIVPSIGKYTNRLIEFYEKQQQYLENYNNVKNTIIWK